MAHDKITKLGEQLFALQNSLWTNTYGKAAFTKRPGKKDREFLCYFRDDICDIRVERHYWTDGSRIMVQLKPDAVFMVSEMLAIQNTYLVQFQNTGDRSEYRNYMGTPLPSPVKNKQ